MSLDKKRAWETALRQLAIDYNAKVEDFLSEGIVLTEVARLPGRRDYTGAGPFLEMITAGPSTVIMADKRLHPALQTWIEGATEPHWLLEFPRLLALSEILAPYGYKLTQTHHGYLPGGSFTRPGAPAGIELKWLERQDIAGLYPNRDWPNALQDGENPARPDVLALAAVDGGKIAGIAGASMDAPGASSDAPGASSDALGLWQTGIDVLPAYRGRGLGKLLVQGLACEVEKRGAVPFYYSSLSNIHSQNIAVSCGFRPAWVDISAEKVQAE